MDVEEKMRDRFRQNLPKFVEKINPIELIPYLPCLGEHNSDDIRNCQNMRTRSEAVQVLHRHLIRKKDGCRQLVAALRGGSLNQPELADLLDPPSTEEPGSSADKTSLGQTVPHKERKEENPESVSTTMPDRSFHPEAVTHGPCNGNTLLKDLPASVIYVYQLLDGGMSTNNWMRFAANLDLYTTHEVYEFEKQPSPSRAVMTDWIQKRNPTLDMLVRKLDEIERKDMLDELEKITHYKSPSLTDSVIPAAPVEDGLPKQPVEINEDRQPVNEQKQPEVDEQTVLKVRLEKNIPDQAIITPDPDDVHPGWKQMLPDYDLTVFKELEHKVEMKETDGDTGYNTSLSSSDQSLNESSLQPLSLDSSLEVDGPRTINKSDKGNEGVKIRYKATDSGKLKMTVNAANIEIPRDQSTEDGQKKLVVRQESMDSCGRPIQAEPSLNSNQFVNLKQERQNPVVRPKQPRNQNWSPFLHSQQPVVSSGSFLKLHTDDAPTLRLSHGFEDTTDGSAEERMSLLKEVSDTVAQNNAARPEKDIPDYIGNGFVMLDLSSLASENSDLDTNICHENAMDKGTNSVSNQIELESSQVSFSTNFQTPASSLENQSYITRLDPNIEVNEAPNNIEDDSPRSGSWSSLTSLGVGLAAVALMVAAYQKFK